jgi:hypothetical protein
MKKIYFTLGILLLGTIGMAYLYFSNLNTERDANDLSLNAIVRHAGLVFCFENDKSFYEILAGQDLLQNVLGEEKSKQLKTLRTKLIEVPMVFKAFENQKVYCGILPGTNGVDYLIATQLKPNSDPKQILKNLGTKGPRVQAVGNLYKLNFGDSTSVFVGFKDVLVLISNEASPIEQILSNRKAENQDFATYIKTNSRYNKNSLANLYLDFNLMPELVGQISSSTLSGQLKIFAKQNSFAAFTYNFSKEKILFNGSTTVNDSDNFYSLFVNLRPQKITIDRILPQKTANYAVYTIGDYLKWQKELDLWMAPEKLKKHIETINQKYRIDLQQVFPKYFKKQFITFQLNTGERFGAIALTDGEKVGQLLLDLSAEYATDVKIFKEPLLPFVYFGTPFKVFERPFYTIIDNYLVMANNASSIQVFLNSYKNNSLLVNDQAYIDFSNQLLSMSTISFYVNRKNSNDIFGRNLKMPYYKQYQSSEGFNGYNAFCYQLSADKGKFLSNVLLYKDVQKKDATDPINTNQ